MEKQFQSRREVSFSTHTDTNFFTQTFLHCKLSYSKMTNLSQKKISLGFMTLSGTKKKRHPQHNFSLGLNHSIYEKNEQNPPYTDL